MKNIRYLFVVMFALSVIAQLAAAPKQSPLKFGVGKTSKFVMPNGDRAYVTGIAGLKASNFSIRDVDKMLTFEDSRIVDAEKSPETHVDDYWCEQLTDCNLLVWTGWAKYAMGVTNEDDFAEILLKNPEIGKKDIFDWTMAKRGYVLDDSTDKVIGWVHGKAKGIEGVFQRVPAWRHWQNQVLLFPSGLRQETDQIPQASQVSQLCWAACQCKCCRAAY